MKHGGHLRASVLTHADARYSPSAATTTEGSCPVFCPVAIGYWRNSAAIAGLEAVTALRRNGLIIQRLQVRAPAGLTERQAAARLGMAGFVVFSVPGRDRDPRSCRARTGKERAQGSSPLRPLFARRLASPQGRAPTARPTLIRPLPKYAELPVPSMESAELRTYARTLAGLRPTSSTASAARPAT